MRGVYGLVRLRFVPVAASASAQVVDAAGRDASEFLDVDVDQVANPVVLVADDLAKLLAGRWVEVPEPVESSPHQDALDGRRRDGDAVQPLKGGGSFEAPVGPGPAQRVLSGFATAEYQHEVTLRIHGTVEQIRAHLPASVASLEEHEPAAGQDPAAEHWLRVELRAQRLDWLPRILASLDRSFVIECPAELRDLVIALADRLTSYARQA
jgi:hypothetical protein